MDELVENTNTISGYLVKGAVKGYVKGLSTERKGRPKFGLPLKIDWTAEDIHALNNFRTEAFHVAGVGSYELEEELKDLAVKYKDDFKLFEENARRKMLDYGIGLEDQSPSGWLKTNLDTAIRSSYHAGEWQRLQDPVLRRIYPAYKYMTVADGNVRPEHAALHGKVYANDDPIWESIFPPNGWSCRCYINTVDSEEAAGENINATSPAEREEIIKQGKINKDFNRNSGMTKSIWGKWLQEKLSGKNYNEITRRMKTEANKLPEPDAVVKTLEDNAGKFRELDYTVENFFKDFPGGIAKTPLGEVKFTNEFFDKLSVRDREMFLGLVKPTLEKPEYIFVDNKNGTVFLKAFAKDKTVIYAGVLKDLGGPQFVSFHQRTDLKDKIKKGKLLIYSIQRESANSKGGQKLATRGSGLNFAGALGSGANITNNPVKDYSSFRVLNGTADDTEVLQEPDEVWADRTFTSPSAGVLTDHPLSWRRGSNLNGSEVSTSTINYIQYGVEGFKFVTVINGAVSMRGDEYGYKFLDSFRKGMLIYNGK